MAGPKKSKSASKQSTSPGTTNPNSNPPKWKNSLGWANVPDRFHPKSNYCNRRLKFNLRRLRRKHLCASRRCWSRLRNLHRLLLLLNDLPSSSPLSWHLLCLPRLHRHPRGHPLLPRRLLDPHVTHPTRRTTPHSVPFPPSWTVSWPVPPLPRSPLQARNDLAPIPRILNIRARDKDDLWEDIPRCLIPSKNRLSRTPCRCLH